MAIETLIINNLQLTHTQIVDGVSPCLEEAKYSPITSGIPQGEMPDAQGDWTNTDMTPQQYCRWAENIWPW